MLWLHLHLLSDATFGRGDGVAGLVDVEVEHDAETGLPYVRGRALKGLLVESCADIMCAAQHAAPRATDRLAAAAAALFGRPGSTREDAATMRVGPALLPDDLARAVRADLVSKRFQPADVLDALTTIRRQSAIDEASGAPAETTLRGMRVVLRDLTFVSALHAERDLDDDQRALLAACALGVRTAGAARNRGRGRVRAWLVDEHGHDVTPGYFALFTQLLTGAAA